MLEVEAKAEPSLFPEVSRLSSASIETNLARVYSTNNQR